MPRPKLSDEERRTRRKESRRRYNNSDKGRAKIAEYNRYWNDNNRPRRNTLNREWYSRNAQPILDHKRLSTYGVTAASYSEMLQRQGGRCAICHSDTPAGKGTWHIDHCHATGQVRGLLCHHCNLGLGHFKDTPEALESAASYLRKHNEFRATNGAISCADESQRP